MDEPPSQPLRRVVGVEPAMAMAGPPAASRLFVSETAGASVRTPSGQIVGKVKDVVVRMEHAAAPVVNGLVVKVAGSDRRFLPWTDLDLLESGVVRTRTDVLDDRPFERRPGEMLLIKDLRDKELVHVEGKRVIRANDIVLEHHEGRWQLAGVDAGAAALLRQMGLGRWVRSRTGRDVIPWDELEMFEDGVPVPLDLTHHKIARMHPADIAQVFHDLGYRQSSELLEDLPDDLAADVVEDLDPEYQATLLSSLNRERAADILDEMEPDAAADVLNDIGDDSPELAAELVGNMAAEEAEAVERLRAYDDHTAGGLMTTEMITMPADLTVAEALEFLRSGEEEMQACADPLFIVSAAGGHRLEGVLRLQELVLAQPGQNLRDLMETEFVTGKVGDSARDAASTIAHYHLPALPIVDDNGDLAGVVYVDDALEMVMPRGWKVRAPRPLRT